MTESKLGTDEKEEEEDEKEVEVEVTVPCERAGDSGTGAGRVSR